MSNQIKQAQFKLSKSSNGRLTCACEISHLKLSPLFCTLPEWQLDSMLLFWNKDPDASGYSRSALPIRCRRTHLLVLRMINTGACDRLDRIKSDDVTRHFQKVIQPELKISTLIWKLLVASLKSTIALCIKEKLGYFWSLQVHFYFPTST